MPRPYDLRQLRRELTGLVLLSIVALVGYGVTLAMARSEHDTSRRDAAAWFQIGERQLDEGRVDDALRSLRRASTIDRGERRYAVALGRALAAAGRPGQAERILRPLRLQAPGDPEINLELARIAAARGAVDDAVHFFHSALFGVWPDESAAARTRIRLELSGVLLRHGRTEAALGELAALGTTMPDTVANHVAAARLLAAAGDADRALTAFRRALRLDPEHQDALAGAGEAAFALGRYVEARRLLAQLDMPSPQLAARRDIAALIISSNPLAPRLSTAQRRRRLAAALDRAQTRVRDCLARADLPPDVRSRLVAAQSAAGPPQASSRGGRDSMERVERDFERAYALEQAADGVCPATPLDAALLAIGQRRDQALP